MYTSPDRLFRADDQVIGLYYVALLKRVLEQRGLQLKGYPDNEGSLSDSRRRTSLRALYSATRKSLASQAPGLGFAYGKELSIVAADCVGQLMISSQNLSQTLTALQRYHSLMSLCLGIRIRHKAATTTVKFQALFGENAPIYIRWFMSEALLLSVQRQASWLCGKPLHYSSIHLPFSIPPNHQEYQQLFGCALHFNADTLKLEFPSSYLALPVLNANPALYAIKYKQCERALKASQQHAPVKERVKAILAETRPNFPPLEQLAERLNTSRSCLYRKLQEENTSYQCLINEFKREQSIYLLKDSLMTISEIAERLGFSDASSFRRAFKNWTGQQPSMLRDIHHRAH